MSSMFNPPHPGLTLRDDILPALNLQVGEAAAQLCCPIPFRLLWIPHRSFGDSAQRFVFFSQRPKKF